MTEEKLNSTSPKFDLYCNLESNDESKKEIIFHAQAHGESLLGMISDENKTYYLQHEITIPRENQNYFSEGNNVSRLNLISTDGRIDINHEQDIDYKLPQLISKIENKINNKLLHIELNPDPNFNSHYNQIIYKNTNQLGQTKNIIGSSESFIDELLKELQSDGYIQNTDYIVKPKIQTVALKEKTIESILKEEHEENIEKTTLQEPEAIEETAMQKTEAVEETAIQKTEAIEETTIQKPEAVEETAMQKTEAVEETAMQKTEAVEETAIQKTEAVEETAIQKTEAVEETAMQKTEAVEETTMQKTEAVEETDMQKTEAVEETDMQKTEAVEETAMQKTEAVEETTMQKTEAVEELAMQKTESIEELAEEETESLTIERATLPFADDLYTLDNQYIWQQYGDSWIIDRSHQENQETTSDSIIIYI